MNQKNLSAAHTLCLRATKLKQKGDFSQSLELYNLALKNAPLYATAYYERSDLPDLDVSDDEVEKMEAILNSSSDQQDQYIVAFALAKAYDKRCDYEKAFHALKKGNQLKRKTLQYDPDLIKRDVMTMTHAFTEGEFANADELGHESKRPIFIVGMPRSGTTLVEQIISAHPKVRAGGELYALEQSVVPLYSKVDMNAPLGERMAQIKKSDRVNAASNYLRQLPKLMENESRVTDKMPHNFLHVGWINLLFGNAKIIHIKRNKIATIFSCYQNYFANGNEYAYDFSELSEYYDSYDLLMLYWSNLFADRIFNLDYENLINNPEKTIEELIEFCGLEWNDACLEFDKNSRKITTLSTTQVRQPIYTNALEHWTNYAPFLSSLSN